MLKILMIDDSKSVHAFVKTCFAAQEVVLVQAFNGQEGLDRFKKDPSVDLILLDWEMPVLDGPGALAALQGLQVKCPVIMMTTRNAPEDIMKMLTGGASEYILKPFTKDILREKIEAILGRGLSHAA